MVASLRPSYAAATVASAVLLAIGAGCDSPSAPPPAPSAAPKAVASAVASATPAAPKCPVASDLAKTLAGIAPGTRIGVAAVLPEGVGGSVPENGIVVELSGGKVLLDGEDTAPLELVDKLKQRMDMRSGTPVLLAVAKDEKNLGPISRIVEAAGETPIHVVATPKGGKRIAMPEALVKDLPAGDVSMRATVLAKAISDEVDDCQPARKVFETLATMDPDARNAALAKDLPAAIEACDCKVDAKIVGLVGYAVGGDTLVVGKVLVVSKDPKATEIALKDLDGAKWYEAVPSDGSPVRLSL